MARPTDCPAFGGECTPRHPLGATMVSGEGACAAYYQYGRRRAAQAKAWLWSEVSETLLESLRGDGGIRRQVAALEQAVAEGRTSPWVAAQQIVETFKQKG